jgi:hypothetical protein
MSLLMMSSLAMAFRPDNDGIYYWVLVSIVVD